MDHFKPYLDIFRSPSTERPSPVSGTAGEVQLIQLAGFLVKEALERHRKSLVGSGRRLGSEWAAEQFIVSTHVSTSYRSV